MSSQQINSRLLVEKISHGYKRVCTFLAVPAALTVAVMMLSITLDATSRYVLNRSIPGVFELNEVLLVICIYMSLAWTQIEKGHIRVTVLLMHLPDKVVAFLDIIAGLVAFCFILALACMSAVGALESIRIMEFRWGSVQMPIWWAKSLVPIGCFMLNFQLLIDIWKDIERLRGRLSFETITISD